MIRLDPRRRPAGWEAVAFAGMVASIAAFALRFHEPWRDEAGAMLEARAVPWRSLLSAMRLEGVPPLFHALLKIAGAFLPDPLALIVVGALGLAVLLAGTYRLLLALSGRPWPSAWLTLAFSITYAYAYELGVMIRQYTLGLGLALLSMAALHEALRRDDRRAVRAGALAAGLSALTSIHSACLAGGALLSFGLVALRRRRSLRFSWPILLTLPAFGLAVYLALPFPDRGGEATYPYHHGLATTAHLSLQAIVEGAMPMDWWFVEGFVAHRLAEPVALLRSLALWGVVAGGALVVAGRIARRRGLFEAMAVLAGGVPLLVVIVVFYWGFYRHHLFLAVPALVVVAGWGLDGAPAGPIVMGARRAGLALLAPWFLFQALLSAGSFILDRRFPFSDTRAAAAAIPRAAHVVSDAYWRSAGILFFRPDVTMRSTSWRGRPFRYIRIDREQRRRIPLVAVVTDECRAAPDRVVFAGTRAGLGKLAPCARPLPYGPRMPFETQPFTWETFDLSRIDCACVAAHR